jgi:hypothetical protein
MDEGKRQVSVYGGEEKMDQDTGRVALAGYRNRADGGEHHCAES